MRQRKHMRLKVTCKEEKNPNHLESVLDFLAESILQESLHVWYNSERPWIFSYFLVCFVEKKEEQYAQVNFCTWKKSAQGSDILVESESEYCFTQMWQNDPVEDRKLILPHFSWILLLCLNKIKSVFFCMSNMIYCLWTHMNTCLAKATVSISTLSYQIFYFISQF